MKKLIEEAFITEDGMRFTTEKEALAHEERLKANHFESSEALITLLKNTDIWKNWAENLDINKANVLEFERKVINLAENLAVEYPEIYIKGVKRRIDLEGTLWSHFEPEAIVAYFLAETRIMLPQDKILELYRKAFSENHSYGTSDTLNEFSRYIEVLEIVAGSLNRKE